MDSVAGNNRLVEKAEPVLAMHPKKFALWLFIVSVVMIFAALTSAYIVKQSDGDWMLFHLPSMFYYSSAVIVLSSVSLHWSYLSAKKDKLEALKIGMYLTTFLGLLFLFLQWKAWGQLVENNVYLVGNVSGSFVYVFSGLHGIHIICAVVFLLVVTVAAHKYKVHSQRLDQMEMCVTFWHFLGGLWLYLFVFLLLNQ